MTNIEDTSPKTIDGYKVVDESIQEEVKEVYTDVYEPGLTKDQLQVGLEVKERKVIEGTLNTSDSLDQVNRVYTLSVPDPDGQIFALSISDDFDTYTSSFKIGFFNNTPLAYSTLETELQNMLPDEYTVEYTSGTNYTISRFDGRTISISQPDIVREVQLNDWDSDAKITIDIDGNSTTVDGATYASANDALDEVIAQLPGATYYNTSASGGAFTITRRDGTAPVITSTEFDRYTYNIIGFDTNHFTGGADYTNVQTTIDSTLFSYSRPGTDPYTYTYINLPTSPTVYTHFDHIRTGSIVADLVYGGLGAGYTFGSISVYPTSGVDSNGWQYPLQKDDYTQITGGTFTVTNNGVTSTSGGFSMTETNHRASITITSHTQISISISLSTSDVYIRTYSTPKKITMTAVSSAGNSEGLYENGEQSCTAKYSSTTENVTDKIFKTSTTNSGYIVEVKKGGFILHFDTSTSNKIKYTCIS